MSGETGRFPPLRKSEAAAMFRASSPLEHDPEKWMPVFRKDPAQAG
jgi:hypothetical protein